MKLVRGLIALWAMSGLPAFGHGVGVSGGAAAGGGAHGTLSAGAAHGMRAPTSASTTRLTLSVQHNAEIQAEIDRILAQKPT